MYDIGTNENATLNFKRCSHVVLGHKKYARQITMEQIRPPDLAHFPLPQRCTPVLPCATRNYHEDEGLNLV